MTNYIFHGHRVFYLLTVWDVYIYVPLLFDKFFFPPQKTMPLFFLYIPRGKPSPETRVSYS